MADWSRYDTCEECGSTAGNACGRVNGARDRFGNPLTELKNPHRDRPVIAPTTPAPTTPEETTVALDVAADARDYTASLDNAERYPRNPTGKRRVDAEVPKDIPRDQWDRPKIVRAVRDPVTGIWTVPTYPPGPEPHAGRPIAELEGYTRASTLGNALEDATGLNVWRTGMVVFGMSRRKDLVLAAQAIPGTDDKKLHRQPLYRIAEQAQEAAEASSAATVGSALHALSEQVDDGTLTVDIGEYQPVLDVYKLRMAGWRIVRSETFVVSDYFHSAGSFDRLITPEVPMALVDQKTGEILTIVLPGDLIVVDLKTATTADFFGAKFFAQLAVYVTGQLYDRDPDSPTYGQRTPLGQRTDFALILHIPQGGDADGEPLAEWHWVDMRAGLALAQLACVNLEVRKKRFTRTHMKRVEAVPAPDAAAADIRIGEHGGQRAVGGLTAIGGAVSAPAPLPSRDPLGDRHLAGAVEFIAASESFPDAQADVVDAELAEDGRPSESRVVAPSALNGANLGHLAVSPAELCAEHGPHAGTVDCPECLEIQAQEAERTGESEQQVAARLGMTFDSFLTDPEQHREQQEAPVPGPEETAPLPAGWESAAEQEHAEPDRNSVPRPAEQPAAQQLGPQLQDAARRHKVEDQLIRKIQAATVIGAMDNPEPDSLLDLHQRASAAGYWSSRVKAAASERKAQLKALVDSA